VGAVAGYVVSTVADYYRLIRLDMEVYQISTSRSPSSR